MSMHMLSAGFPLAVSYRAASRDSDLADDAVVAALFGALAVEAWTNELLFKVRETPDLQLVGGLRQLKPMIRAARLEEVGTKLRTRLDVIAAALTQHPLDWGRQPFQDLDLLFAIRNDLAHQRPEVFDIDEVELGPESYGVRQRKLAGLAERLVKRNIVPRPDAEVVTPALVLFQQRACGVWAFNTTVATILAVRDLFPAGHWRATVTFGLTDHLTPLPLPGVA